MKEEKFEKVVEWSYPFKESGERIDDKRFLWYGIISMIPILGQFFWLCYLVSALYYRKVYWRKIK